MKVPGYVAKTASGLSQEGNKNSLVEVGSGTFLLRNHLIPDNELLLYYVNPVLSRRRTTIRKPRSEFANLRSGYSLSKNTHYKNGIALAARYRYTATRERTICRAEWRLLFLVGRCATTG